MYLSMISFSPAKIQGHLKLKKDPFWYGLGNYEDEEGVLWHINGVFGQTQPPTVCARQVALHPDYYGTHIGASSNGWHTWLPYTVSAPKPVLPSKRRSAPNDEI